MTDRLPRISILTPSFNQGHFIRQTIDSVLSQNYPDLEYKVFDGGSKDDTVSILKEYGDRLQWVSERDRGQSDAINKGFRWASGEIVAFINSDDWLEPGCLATVGKFFRDHPEAHWVTGKCRTVDAEGLEIRKPITAYKNFWLKSHSLSVLRVLNYVSQPATFWRRSAIDTVGYMDESLHYAMDYDYWLRFAKHYRLHYIDQYLANFRFHNTSKAGAIPANQFHADMAIARSHVSNPALLGIHALHNWAAITVYNILSRRGGQEAADKGTGKAG